MTAITPPSATPGGPRPEATPPRPVTMSGLSGPGGNSGVPLSIPLPFMLTGVSGAALFGVLLPFVAPDALIAPELPHVLTLVHVATLGWLTMIIMGASIQLAPVILVTPLQAARVMRVQYPIYAGGVVLLLSGFWWMQPWLMALGGSLVVVGVLLYVTVLGLTVARATTRPLTTRFLVAALAYLCVVVSLGLTAALNFQLHFLGANVYRLLLAHLTVGVAGWLSMMLIGVSYQLVRMFALAHGHDDRLGRIVFILLNAGLLALATAFSFAWLPLAVAGGVLLVAAIWLFASDYIRMLRTRRRKILDVTQRHGIAAVAYLTVVMTSAVVVAIFGWGHAPLVRVLAALGLLAFVGWLGQSTIGYLYKIVPFLIWNTRFGPLVGREKVPLMRDLIRERWATVSWWLINLGLPATALALLVGWAWPLRLAGVVLGAGLVLAAANIVRATSIKRA